MRFAHATAALAFLLLIPFFSGAADCTVVNGNCAGSDVCVVAMTGQTNSHAAKCGTGGYAYSLCCPSSLMQNAQITSGPCAPLTASLNLTLYNQSGGHVAWDGPGGYPNTACFSPAMSPAPVCVIRPSCNPGDDRVASLASTTNSHLGVLTAYPNVICCSSSAASYVGITCPGDRILSNATQVQTQLVLNGKLQDCATAQASVSVPGATTTGACSGNTLTTNITIPSAGAYTATASYPNLTAAQCSFWMQPVAASVKAPEANLLLIALLPALAVAFLRWRKKR